MLRCSLLVGLVMSATSAVAQSDSFATLPPPPDLDQRWSSSYGTIVWSENWYGTTGNTFQYEDPVWDPDREAYVLQGYWGRRAGEANQGGIEFVFSDQCSFTGAWWYNSSPDSRGGWTGQCTTPPPEPVVEQTVVEAPTSEPVMDTETIEVAAEETPTSPPTVERETAAETNTAPEQGSGAMQAEVASVAVEEIEDVRTFPLMEVFLISSPGNWSLVSNIGEAWESTFGLVDFGRGTYREDTGTIGFTESRWNAVEEAYVVSGIWQEGVGAADRGGLELIFTNDCEFTGHRWSSDAPDVRETWNGQCEEITTPLSPYALEETEERVVVSVSSTGDPVLDQLFEDPFAANSYICQNAMLQSRVSLGIRYNRFVVWPTGLPDPDEFNRGGYGASSGPLAPYYNRIVEELQWRHDNDPRVGREARAFHAPLYIDPFHACNSGMYTPFSGEYAIFLNQPSPRVIGDICSAEPVILYQTVPGMDEARLVAHVLLSSLAQGDVLSIDEFHLFRTLRQEDLFDREVTWIVALVAEQCGRLPEAITLKAVRQDRDPALIAADLIDYETLYEGQIVPGERGIILADAQLTTLGQQAYQDYYRSQAPYRRAAEVRRNFEENFGLGVATFFGLLGAMYVWSPCNDPALSDAEKPGFCD